MGLSRIGRQNKKTYKENIEHFKNCKDALYQMATYGHCNDFALFIDSYKNKAVKPVKVLDIVLCENDPILICVVKDDLSRIKIQIEYHRKIGVKHFAYIDNMSKDGTFEWLEKQNDVSLFSTSEEYRSARQRSWMRQTVDFLGYDKWYLDLDSDELFSYPGIENKPISKYIDFLEKKNIQSVFTLVLDMYSKNSLFSSFVSEYDFLKEYCYFDTDTYKIQKTILRYNVSGGPRTRILSKSDQSDIQCLTNYSLVKWSKSMIIRAHHNFPLSSNFETSLPIAVILHYKFLPQDHLKFEDHVKTGVHVGGSAEYKRYMKTFNENPCTSFYHERSQKLDNSMDLMKIDIINKGFFGEFLAK